MIHLNNISLYFPESDGYILRDITWRIGPNEKWVLFGKNGSGKTRLLEIITGYIPPSSGEVFRFGNPPRGTDIRDLRKRIGYVSTFLREMFPPRETLLDVVISGVFASVGLYDEPTPEERDRAVKLLSSIAMEDRAADRFGILSDGEKQKVMMLRALICDPDMLILDEPARGLDLAAREDLLAAIETATAGRSLSAVYVTHHTEEISPLFTNILILEQGECFFQGRIDQGLTGGLLTELFGREVEVTRLHGRYYTTLRPRDRPKK